MALTGDFAKLRRTALELSTFGHRVTPEIVDVAADEALDQYAGGLAGARDPWGNAWQARKDGGKATLGGSTGPLGAVDLFKGRLIVKLRPDRLWAIHQAGANNMHSRATLPFSPSKWDEPIQDRIERVVMGAFTTDD
jgi:hypothetical protein